MHISEDVAAGHNLSISSQIREGFTTSTCLSYMKREQKQHPKIMSHSELFQMATLGGAKCKY